MNNDLHDWQIEEMNEWMNFWSSPPLSFSPQPRRVTNVTEQSYATPNGHNLSDMHVQSILILLSETRAPSHCSAIQSHVTCLSLIVSLTCQISLEAGRKIAKQSELICGIAWYKCLTAKTSIMRIKSLISKFGNSNLI